MGDHAGLLHPVNQNTEVVGRRGDAGRRDAHRGAVAGAQLAGLGHAGAGGQRADGPPGGRAEQVQRPAGAHGSLPGHQPSRQLGGISAPVPLDQQPRQQHCLLSVVGNRAGRLSGRERMIGRSGPESPDEHAVPGNDLFPGQRLGGHAERIADGQPVKRTGSA
jgi:hypothetical protein